MAEIHSIQQDVKFYRELEARLEANDLTQSELQEIQEILLSTPEKTKQLVKPLFERLERKKESLRERQIAVLNEVSDFSKQIAFVGAQMNDFAPEEMAEALIELEKRASHLLPEEISDPRVFAIAEGAKKELEHLQFTFICPIVTELDANGLEPTFASRLQAIAAKLGEQKEIWMVLNPRQQTEVLTEIGGKGSLELLSHGIEMYLSALKGQAAVAEDFFHGRVELGMEGLIALPEEVRLRIDQLIWEEAGGEPIDPTDENSRMKIVSAILRSVEERMGIE